MPDDAPVTRAVEGVVLMHDSVMLVTSDVTLIIRVIKGRRKLFEGCHGEAVIRQSQNLGADLLVWIHSHGAQPTAIVPITRVLSNLKNSGVVTLTYHLDLFYGIPQRFSEYLQHPYMNDLDYFFSVDPPLVDWINKNTATKAHYLTPGVLESECRIEPRTGSSPIIFVGSYNYHKEWPYRPQLIDWLRTTYGNLFTGHGPNFGGVVRGAELNRLYANSKIVVGDSFSPNFDYPGYWSDRIPETLGRGGFLIHPWIEGIDEFYEDRKHLVLYDFGDFDQLKSLIDHYLGDAEEREEIRIAGHEHVKANHTFTNRWKHILETVSN